ncbi:Flp pilus assembly complex ATPase component TadA [Microbacteriaceae bacterium K1510]|nr:Flp pilus assembly complex ATPase component TadA [Microbacteriaceae bacterium K1510]
MIEMPELTNSSSGRSSEWLNELLNRAIADRVSDLQIRLDREERTLVVRGRVNRVMAVVGRANGDRATEITVRVKSNSGIPSGPAQVIGDGLYPHQTVDGQRLDIRVAVLPTFAGETIQLRLPSVGDLPSLEKVGFSEHNRERVSKLVGMANGLVLVAGPMGAGKTTTLYALLAELGSADRTVYTVEDPVERELEGIDQIQINSSAGNGWREVLRGLRRSDAEVMMIGEVRDEDQASAALEIGNAGAKVISSIHANDSVGAVSMLMELAKVPPRTLGNQLRGVISQRLLRVRCVACVGAGCEVCSGTGYAGGVRTVHEVLVLDDDFVNVLIAGGAASALRNVARVAGMTSLRENALDLVAAGVTDEREVRKVLGHE